ncbi:MAG: hypothetical protein LBK28_05940 [Propionibacteriaceae bacterium]|jgi:hypothetical protein|nr:hypothetical protein [Propionibacteriaceae bacterium]
MGAWREVLDQFPVLTLNAILGRVRHELVSNGPIGNIVLATGGRAALTNARRRIDTLAVAMRAKEANYAGIKYCLNKERTANGFALFGPEGKKNEGDDCVASWTWKATIPALQDEHLLEMLRWRERNDPAFPVVYRCFPPSVS